MICLSKFKSFKPIWKKVWSHLFFQMSISATSWFIILNVKVLRIQTNMYYNLFSKRWNRYFWVFSKTRDFFHLCFETLILLLINPVVEHLLAFNDFLLIIWCWWTFTFLMDPFEMLSFSNTTVWKHFQILNRLSLKV